MATAKVPSQDIYSLQKATVGRILCPCDFPVDSAGIFPLGFCFPGVQIFMCYCYIILHILIIQFFKAMYPLSACTASLIWRSSIDFNVLLIFLSFVLHNLWTFTKSHLHSFQGGYNLIIYEMDGRQWNFVSSLLESIWRPSRSVSEHLTVPNE